MPVHDPINHVVDSSRWDLIGNAYIPLPSIPLFGYNFQITKFMILELLAAGLLCLFFIPLGRKARDGKPPKGWWTNARESLLTFIRDEVVKPNLREDADFFMPFFWTLFVFILILNLFGFLPLLSSATASISLTLSLAFFSLLMFHGAAIWKLGFFRYLKSLWPHIEIMPYPYASASSHGHGHGHHDHGHGDAHGHDHGHDAHGHSTTVAAEPKGPVAWWMLPLWVVATAFGQAISCLIFLIEFFGTFIKSGVLAFRLFINIFAGHIVSASILTMIVVLGGSGITWIWGLSTAIIVLGVTLLGLLELFVAFLQAYVFTFLTAVFTGMAMHPSH